MLSTEEYISKVKKVHHYKYKYDKTVYKGADKDIVITCPTHGDFTMRAHNHLNGQGCPKCAGRNLTTEDIIEMFHHKHGDKYDYSQVAYTKMHSKVKIICPIHGEFLQTPSKHLLGQGCPKCAINERSAQQYLSNEEFIRKSHLVHCDKYNYDKTEYESSHGEVIITCPTHGDFKQRANDHLNGHGCPKCGNIISKWEDEIEEYLQSLEITTVRNNKDLLDRKYEIDIYLPSYNIGIECDGLKWHSEEYRPKEYHLEKTEYALNKGIRLIHIFEDEWRDKKDIVKSLLASILNKNTVKIYARKTQLKEIDFKTSKEFIDSNHLQGNTTSLINIALLYNNEIVAVMTFGKRRRNLGYKGNSEDEYELIRYCSKQNFSIIGGASKIFKYFIETYKPKRVISYCDRRYSMGNLYMQLGFKLDHISKPNYYYLVGTNRQNRFRYRKDQLVKEGFDPNKTEAQIMKERNIYRIYDCGTYAFIYQNE